MPRAAAFALAIAAVSLASQSHAQINKCVDAGGKTYYSQAACPPNTKASSVRQAPPPAAAPAGQGAAKAAGPKSAAEQELEFRKRRTEKVEADKKAQEKSTEAAQRADNCRSARGTLAGLEAGGRQTRINEKGERVFLDDAQVAQERQRARTAVEEWCKGL
jgi:hypothetical protein